MIRSFNVVEAPIADQPAASVASDQSMLDRTIKSRPWWVENVGGNVTAFVLVIVAIYVIERHLIGRRIETLHAGG